MRRRAQARSAATERPAVRDCVRAPSLRPLGAADDGGCQGRGQAGEKEGESAELHEIVPLPLEDMFEGNRYKGSFNISRTVCDMPAFIDPLTRNTTSYLAFFFV